MTTAAAPRPIDSAALALNPMDGGRSWHRLTVALCCGMLVVGVWFRFWRLDHLPGVNGDEAWGGVQAVRLLAGEEFSWRTPTGNPLNPFYFLPLVALHAFGQPSFLLLRLPAAISGIAALAANWWLCRRTIDARTAVVSTVLLAVLPVNIAYSRFGWDASQTLLASVLVIYPAIKAAREPSRRRWLLASAVALGGALLVHPTNVFLAPFPAIAGAIVWRADLARLVRRPWTRRHAALFVATLAGAAVLAWLGRHWLAVVAGRIAAPQEAVEFARHYLRLFSGATVYQYITGTLRPAGGAISPGLLLHDLAALAAGVLVVGMWCRMLRRGLAAGDACLVIAWALVLLGFFLVAGPRAIAPHYERYAICLVAPGALLAARAAAWGIEITGGRRARWPFALACGGSAMLVLCYVNYFDCLQRTGGRSHVAFRTAATEPKEQALLSVLAQREVGQSAWIVASSWWSYWPIAYLASGEADVRVVTGDDAWQQSDVRQALDAGRLWIVEFAGTEAEREVLERLTAEGRRVERTEIVDSAGHVVLTVMHPR